MAKKKDQKITVNRYVHDKDGSLINVEDLSPEDRKRFSQWLTITYLNALFRGKGEFRLKSDMKEGTV